ncbi:hypothetical protein [Moorena bouillonii]|uniref:hypothetical protein n=1 Tax=Moorena bouillonii TaxID=207920 RepID=UPI0018E9E19F|nr:hypothetical protein [Moorena bouillonii]
MSTPSPECLLTGLTYARRFDPTHAMNVDADDCLSKQLAEFVRHNLRGNGWFINRGYKYRDGEDCLYLKRKQFYRMVSIQQSVVSRQLINGR